MGIESKVDFMRDVEMSLSEKVTVHDMNIVMKAIADVLEGYEMETARTWAEDQDDLMTCYIAAMKVECRSQKTIDRYVYIIRRMMDTILMRGEFYEVRQSFRWERRLSPCRSIVRN